MFSDIKVGYTCNNKCLHCIVEPGRLLLEKNEIKQDASLSEIKETIDKARDMGLKSITLTGGEITLREDANDIIRYACGTDLYVSIQTNGRLIDKLNFELLELYKSKVNFTVALHGSNHLVHDAVTQCEGSFFETARNMRKLIMDGFSVTGKIVISKINLSDLHKLILLLNDMGVKETLVAFPHAGCFSTDVFSAVVPRYTEVDSVINSIYEDEALCGMRLETESIPMCFIRNPTNWGLSVDFKEILDELYSVSNSGKVNVLMTKETYDWRTARKNMKRKGPLCSQCVMNPYCEGVWEEYVEAFGTDEFVPLKGKVETD